MAPNIGGGFEGRGDPTEKDKKLPKKGNIEINSILVQRKEGEPQLDFKIRNIKELVAAKEFKLALDLAEKLKKQYPDNPKLLKLIDSISFDGTVDIVKKGILEDGKLNIDSMIKFIDKKICRNEENDYKINFMIKVIEEIHLSNNSKLAQEYAEKFLEKHLKNVELLYLLGKICSKTGDTAKAIEYYERATDLYNETKSPRPKRDNKSKGGDGRGGDGATPA